MSNEVVEHHYTQYGFKTTMIGGFYRVESPEGEVIGVRLLGMADVLRVCRHHVERTKGVGFEEALLKLSREIIDGGVSSFILTKADCEEEAVRTSLLIRHWLIEQKLTDLK